MSTFYFHRLQSQEFYAVSDSRIWYINRLTRTSKLTIRGRVGGGVNFQNKNKQRKKEKEKWANKLFDFCLYISCITYSNIFFSLSTFPPAWNFFGSAEWPDPASPETWQLTNGGKKRTDCSFTKYVDPLTYSGTVWKELFWFSFWNLIFWMRRINSETVYPTKKMLIKSFDEKKK